MVNCLYIRPVIEIEIVNIISDFKDSAAGWDELNPASCTVFEINIQNWLWSNKLSLNVLKTHSIIFTTRNKIVDSIDIKERVYTTKFLGVHIDS